MLKQLMIAFLSLWDRFSILSLRLGISEGSHWLLPIAQNPCRQDGDSYCQSSVAKQLTMVVLLTLGGGFTPGVLAQQSPTLTYDADLSLNYIDVLDGPKTSLGENNADRNTVRSRTLGLRHFKMNAHFTLLGGSKMDIGLRPDALTNRGLLVTRRAESPADDTFQDNDPKREFDSRAAAVYRDQPRISLLDTYTLTYLAGQNLQVSAGVFRQLHFPSFPYQSPLEFGLNIPYPEKFSGLELYWRNTENRPVAVAEKKSVFWFSLHVFQGHDDRSEYLSEDDDGFDRGPASEDPYLGGGFKVGLDFSRRLQIGLLAGFYDTRTDLGKRSDAFYNIVLDALLPDFGVLKPKLGFGIQYQNLSWNFIADQKISPLDRLAVSSLFDLGWGRNHFLLGGYYGQGELYRPGGTQATEVWGYQVELGYRRELAANLDFGLMMVQENRRQKEDGKESGGFLGTAGNQTGLVRRVLISLDYAIAGGTL